jgi:hypothetical protein
MLRKPKLCGHGRQDEVDDLPPVQLHDLVLKIFQQPQVSFVLQQLAQGRGRVIALFAGRRGLRVRYRIISKLGSSLPFPEV